MAASPDVPYSTATMIAQLHPGDHVCHLYNTEDEHRLVLTPFLQYGLERGERVLYVADFHTPFEILNYLSDTGLDVAAYQARDQFRLLSPADGYMQAGVFDPRRMIAHLEQETDQALHDGFTALRVTGEMTWALRGLPGSDRLIEYEFALDRFFATHPALAICQYDRRRFGPEILLRMIEVHPLVIVGTEVCDNFYFVPPSEAARPDHLERQLTRQLDKLTERRRFEVSLWQQRRQLEQEILSRTHDLAEVNQHLQHEVEERRQAEDTLRESEEKYRHLVQTANEAIYIVQQGRIQFVNSRCAQLTGWPEAELVGCSILDLTPDEDKAAIAAHHQRLLDGELQTSTIECRIISRTGEDHWLLVNAVRIIWNGQLATLNLASDITERKQADLVLQARLRLVQYAVDHTVHEVLVATLDEAGQLTGSPIGFYHFLEPDQKTLSLQAWSTRTTREFCTAAGEGQHYSVDMAGVWVDCVLERQPVIHNDYANLPAARRKGLPDGHAAVVRELVVPVFRGGLIVAILGMGNKPQPYGEQDLKTVTMLADLAWEVAERKLAEAAQRESEEKYRNLFHNASIGIFHSLPEGRFLRVNPALAIMLGYASPEELVSTITDIRTQVYIDTNTHAVLLDRALQREGWVYAENRYRRKDGSILIGNLAIRKVLQADGSLAYLEGFVEDITERKRSADAEHDQRTLAEALRDTATALISTLNLDEVLDRVLLSVGRVAAHEAVSIMLLDETRTIARVARYHGYAQLGSEQQVRTLAFDLMQTANLRQLYQTRQPLVIADTQDYPDWLTGTGREWIRSYAGVPIRSREQVVGFINLYSSTPGFYTQIQAERLQAFADQAAVAVENAQLHARIQQQVDELELRVAERTRELTAANVRLTELDRLKDEFISRISHELRTPLTNIRIYLELLEHGKPEKHSKYLQVLDQQSALLQGLIENLLDVSRLNTPADAIHLTPISLNDAARELIHNSQTAATRHGLTLTLHLAGDLPSVRSEAGVLSHALSPIMSNALTYTPVGGDITVSTALQTTADGRHWGTLTVRDTGPGIDPAETGLIFDRFYRGSATRDYKTPGTGLGLSISRDLIDKLGGHITVVSTLGQGAAFTVWLPLATGPDNGSLAKSGYLKTTGTTT